MSGNTIGGIAGGLIGFAIGGPAGAQWGWMIGSVVGGIVDPQTIQGAQWQNQQLQGSSDGLARAIVLGTSTVTGNLLDAEPGGPRIGKMSEGGKGGPEVERDTAILTYAIEICDSSELRGTLVRGVIAVWEDEKLVYDVRPDENGVISGERSAASAKWLANKRFYFGAEDQEPPAELVAIHGIGNVPAYRGTCLMGVLDEDLMVDIDDKPRGRIPTYRFLVSQCEPVLPDTPAFLPVGKEGIAFSKDYVHPLSVNGTWVGPTRTTVNADSTSFIGQAIRWGAYVYLFLGLDFGENSVRVADIGDFSSWSDGPTLSYPDSFGELYSFSATNQRLWLSGNESGLYYLLPDAPAFENIGGFVNRYGAPAKVFSVCCAGNSVVCAEDYGKVWRSDADGPFVQVYEFSPEGAGAFRPNQGAIATDGDRIVIVGTLRDFGGCAGRYTDNLGDAWAVCNMSGISPEVSPRTVAWVGGDVWVMSASGASAGSKTVGGFYISTNRAQSFVEIDLGGVYHGASRGSIAVDGKSGSFLLTGYDPVTPTVVKMFLFRRKGIAQFDIIEVDQSGADMYVTNSFTLNPLNYNTDADIPDAPGYYLDKDGNVIGPDLPVGTMCSIPLDQAVRKLHKIGAPQLTDDEFDLTALEGEIVRGYTIQDAEVTVATACDPLRKVWTFDLPAYDGKVRAIKRGRAVDWELSEDDLVAMDSGYEESVQDESLAFPLKMHLAYTDPVIDYKETTQTHERYSADARVAGEEKVSMGQLVMSATEAKQAVVKTHKTLWANIEDTRKLSMPIEYIHAVNSDTFTFRNRRYRVDSMRVEGMQVVLESAAYDRISSYQSSAIGVEGTAGPGKLGSLRGPTISAIMNLPVLRPEHDGPGVYWAATGVLDGWDGAKLQISRYGANYVDSGVATKLRATIGELEAVLPVASRYGMSKTTEVKVKLNKLAAGIGGTDMLGLLRGDNAAAILRPDGTAEIIQFLTATETSPGKYTLGGILRGRLNTAPAEHAIGAKFVLLDGAVTFVPLRNEDSDTGIGFRAVSLGTKAEMNIGGVQHVSKFVSMTEWAPGCVRADVSSGSLEITFSGRGRIGSSRIPVHSANFKEYRITVLQGTGGIEVQTRDQFVTIGGLTDYDSISIVALSDVAATFNSEEGDA